MLLKLCPCKRRLIKDRARARGKTNGNNCGSPPAATRTYFPLWFDGTNGNGISKGNFDSSELKNHIKRKTVSLFMEDEKLPIYSR